MEIEEAIHAIWFLTQKEKGADVKTDNRKKAVGAKQCLSPNYYTSWVN